jgi:hypothetical protein
MAVAISDGIHVAGTLVRAGFLKPSRPDRALRALLGLHRFGPTLAAGYVGAAARYPAAPAVIDEAGTLTFKEVDRRTNALARGLAGHGLTEGETVAVMCRNHRGFVEASVACSKLGVHVVLLNTGFAAPQVAEVVDRENVGGLIYDEEFRDTVREARAGRASFLAWQEEGADVGVPENGDTGAPENGSLAELIATRVDTQLPPPAAAGRAVILTSGTTGCRRFRCAPGRRPSSPRRCFTPGGLPTCCWAPPSHRRWSCAGASSLWTPCAPSPSTAPAG